MVRIPTLVAFALSATVAMPLAAVAAHDAYRSTLDDAERIGQAWSTTSRFDGVILAGNDDVAVTRGDSFRIRASGDPAVVADLRYMVKDGKLTIGRRSRERSLPGKAQIEVVSPKLADVVLAGSGDIAIDVMSGTDVDATVAGSGSIAIGRVEAQDFAGVIAGSGNLRVGGRARRADLTIAGRGDIDAAGFSTGGANVSIAGSGDVRFTSTGRVNASIAGSGSAIVTGTTDCTVSRVGSGRLNCSR